MLVDVGQASVATKNTTREEIAKRAERITPGEIELVQRGLRQLAFQDPDGARVVNDAGFSKIDVSIGHRLADLSELSSKQAALGAKLVGKYHRQIPQDIAGVWKALGERGADEVPALEIDAENDKSEKQTLSSRRR